MFAAAGFDDFVLDLRVPAAAVAAWRRGSTAAGSVGGAPSTCSRPCAGACRCVNRLGCHMLVVSRKRDAPVAAHAATGVWPGPFSRAGTRRCRPRRGTANGCPRTGCARSLVRRHRRLCRFCRRATAPIPGRGGWTYLDLRESPMMLARVLRDLRGAEVRARCARSCAPRDVFVDVGANKGDFSLVRGPADARHRHACCASNPSRPTSSWIERSVARNRYRRVEVAPVSRSPIDAGHGHAAPRREVGLAQPRRRPTASPRPAS